MNNYIRVNLLKFKIDFVGSFNIFQSVSLYYYNI